LRGRWRLLRGRRELRPTALWTRLLNWFGPRLRLLYGNWRAAFGRRRRELRTAALWSSLLRWFGPGLRLLYRNWRAVLGSRWCELRTAGAFGTSALGRFLPRSLRLLELRTARRLRTIELLVRLRTSWLRLLGAEVGSLLRFGPGLRRVCLRVRLRSSKAAPAILRRKLRRLRSGLALIGT
jgi:hypothetical protein